MILRILIFKNGEKVGKLTIGYHWKIVRTKNLANIKQGFQTELPIRINKPLVVRKYLLLSADIIDGHDFMQIMLVRSVI